MVAASQREELLWHLPTSDVDLSMHFAPAEGTEICFREEDPFGSASITVTWIALNALAKAFGARPDLTSRNVFPALQGYRSPKGAYGRPLPGLKPGLGVNASPRHTAMALLIHLCFGDTTDLAGMVEALTPTVTWLVDVMFADGGWAYEFSSGNDPEMEAYATVCSVAALCRFLPLISERTDPSSVKLVNRIDHAVSKSFRRLDGLRNGSVWPGVYKQRTQIADTTFAISLLRDTVVERTLGTLVEGAPEIIHDMSKGLLDIATNDGWPSCKGGSGVSLPATVGALQVVLENHELDISRDLQQKISDIESYVIRAVHRSKSWEQMRMPDWAALVHVATEKIGHLTAEEQERDREKITAIREAAHHNKLNRRMINSLPRFIHQPVLYALTRGNPNSVANDVLEQWYRATPWWVRSAVVPGALFLLGVVTAGLFSFCLDNGCSLS